MLNDGIGIFYVAVDHMLDWGMLNDGAGIFQVAVDQLLDWGMLNHGIGIFVVAADQLCLLQLEVNQCSAKVLPDLRLCGLVWSITVFFGLLSFGVLGLVWSLELAGPWFGLWC